MIEPAALLGIALLTAISLMALPSMPIGRFLRARRAARERASFEDILRQTLQMQQDGKPVNAESLAGTLGRPVTQIRGIMARMAELDLISGDHQSIRLSPDGERWAMHILRAHRLWESYLADEAGLPMARLHQQAELAEHKLSPEDLEVIDARLGHPAEDPHGDPIPTAEGMLDSPRGIPLPTWSGGEYVRVVHVEDEPDDVFKRLLSKGVLPGTHLRLLDTSPTSIRVAIDGRDVEIESELLANVQVEEDLDAFAHDSALARLSTLRTGESGEIFALSDAIRGFSRRRLLDFGVTRGTRIEPVLDNPFGDPRAFRVRGTTIGIRRDQADLIWVRRTAAAPSPSPIRPW